MKHLMLFFSFIFLLASRMDAQIPKTAEEEERIRLDQEVREQKDKDERDKRIRARKVKEQRKDPVTSIRVQANHDFYFSLNDGPVEKVAKNTPKVIKLDDDVHKLEFEEAESTGERIERYFKMTPAMIKARFDTLYTVNFQKDLASLLDTKTVSGTNPERTETQPDNPDKTIQAVAAQLQTNMVPFPGGTQKNYAGVETAILPLNFGKYEVTQQQWEVVMGYNKSSKKSCPSCPVENVSWNEVDAFISKLNQAGSKKFRLPTEAEWEYVAKQILQNETDLFAPPEQRKKDWENFLSRTAWYNNAQSGTQAVGNKTAAFGVHDLWGNVAEWCADASGLSASGGGGGVRNAAANKKKAIRGGSFLSKADELQIQSRDSELPGVGRKSVGFRLLTDAN